MQNSLILIIACWLIVSCEPARSDVFEEVVNPELVKTLLEKADSTIEIFPDSLSQNMNGIWIKGKQLFFKDAGRSTILWFDEQERISGMIEYEKDTLKDSIHFFPNGQRMFSLLFNKDGKPSGPARFYFPDGRVYMDGRFDNGLRNGIWREFEADGRLKVTHEYDKSGNQKR